MSMTDSYRRVARTVWLGVFLAILGCDEGTPGDQTAGSAAPSASVAATGTPKIVAIEPVFEFGSVKLGSSVEHVFKVKNAGDGPLTITRAKGS